MIRTNEPKRRISASVEEGICRDIEKFIAKRKKDIGITLSFSETVELLLKSQMEHEKFHNDKLSKK